MKKEIKKIIENMEWELDIMKFRNGNIMVFNKNGEQVAELQGNFKKSIPKIIKWLKKKWIKKN